eukprot:GABV01009211.1.p1 GENE.GABV01009211.1~~GABV01009211.1.p1  ORF type:complete len:140 (-),score=6.86 GABV01009211.1:93-512(-)
MPSGSPLQASLQPCPCVGAQLSFSSSSGPAWVDVASGLASSTSVYTGATPTHAGPLHNSSSVTQPGFDSTAHKSMSAPSSPKNPHGEKRDRRAHARPHTIEPQRIRHVRMVVRRCFGRRPRGVFHRRLHHRWMDGVNQS